MFIAVFALMGLAAMLLWNALIPDLFHGPILNYWQALGLVVLSRVLFGFKGPRRHWWKPWHWGRKPWKHRDTYNWMREEWNCGPQSGSMQCGPSSWDWRKWSSMTPEERENAKQEWKQSKEEWKQGFKSRFGNADKPSED